MIQVPEKMPWSITTINPELPRVHTTASLPAPTSPYHYTRGRRNRNAASIPPGHFSLLVEKTANQSKKRRWPTHESKNRYTLKMPPRNSATGTGALFRFANASANRPSKPHGGRAPNSLAQNQNTKKTNQKP